MGDSERTRPPCATYAIVFISGSAVMAFEILSARAIAPVYGGSLHVWASVIGLTLGALTVGYFAGGWAIDRWPRRETLGLMLLIAAVLTALAPIAAKPILVLTEPLGPRIGVLVSSFLILIGPLGALGTITPAATRLATMNIEGVGRTAGNIYAVSTLGGILSSFACGFYILPYWGVLTTALLTACSLLLAAALARFSGRQRFATAGATGVVLLALLGAAMTRPDRHPAILHQSDGLLGELTVLENGDDRWLLIDGVGQTLIQQTTGNSRFAYIHCMTYFAGHFPPGRRALVLGLGGGTLANELRRLGFTVDAVELDDRIVRLGRTHFRLDPSVRVFIDDARHYVRNCRERYSYIAIDCFTAEREPTHLLTLESLAEINAILEPDGVLVLDYRSYLEGPRGLGARSILRTLRTAGLTDYCFGTMSDPDERDLIMVGAKDPAIFAGNRPVRLNLRCCGDSATRMLRHRLQVDFSDGYVLTDDTSPLDVLNIVYHEQWRRRSRKRFHEILDAP